jgi:hypothetical protein
MPEEGLEPSRDCSHRILSPARLPVPPLRPVQLWARHSNGWQPFGHVRVRVPVNIGVNFRRACPH